MEAQYVATFNGNKTTHSIREGWSYDRISQARTGCGIKGSFTVEHRQSGRPIKVTCRRAGCGGGE